MFSRNSEFGLSKIGNLPLERSSLATEGTQEFPPLKKTVSRKYQFMPNILSLSDNASYKLAFIDAAELQIRQDGGNRSYHRSSDRFRQNQGSAPNYNLAKQRQTTILSRPSYPQSLRLRRFGDFRLNIFLRLRYPRYRRTFRLGACRASRARRFCLLRRRLAGTR